MGKLRLLSSILMIALVFSTISPHLSHAQTSDLDDELLTESLKEELLENSVLIPIKDENGTVQPQALPIAYLVGIGVVTVIGYFWWDNYKTAERKKQLINECYRVGGTPVIDERDDFGIKVDPKVTIEAKKVNGFNFACER